MIGEITDIIKLYMYEYIENIRLLILLISIMILPLILVLIGSIGGNKKLNQLFSTLNMKATKGILDYKYGSKIDRNILINNGISEKEVSYVDTFAEILLSGIILLIIYIFVICFNVYSMYMIAKNIKKIM